MVCENGSGYMVAEVKKVTTGMWYEDNIVEVTPLKSKGLASGKTVVKIFNINDEIDASNLDGFVRIQGENKVNSGWKITSETKTHLHVSGDQTKIYWLQDPSHDQHPVTRGYANANYVKQSDDIASMIFGRKFKFGFNTTDPRDGDGYCYFGSNYMYVSTEDLNKQTYCINCDDYPDKEVTGSGQKHPIMVCQQNADGEWGLVGSGYWPGGTDCRDGYLYIKNMTWTKSNFVKGQEYRIKVSPFW